MQESSDEILKYFKRALAENEENPGPVLFEMSQFLFQNGYYEGALEQLVKCQRLKYRSEEILDIIMEAYYEPNIEDFKSKYERNVRLLSNYQYIKQKDYPSFCDLRYCFVPYSDNRFIIFDKTSGEFGADFDLRYKEKNLDALKNEDILIIGNEFCIETITMCETQTRPLKSLLWEKIPLYLYYHDFDEFAQYLQVVDFTEMVKTDRLVFLVSEQEFSDWFANPQAIIPTKIIGTYEVEKIEKLIAEIFQKRDDGISVAKQKTSDYYNKYRKQEILKSIRGGKPRILFLTTRFSTALQYFIRDCVLACDTLGIPNRLIIEADDVHRLSDLELLLMIEKFKPDIFFLIDHFRWERPWLPDNLAFVCWIQDPLPHIMSQESASKVTNMDFLLNLFFTSKEFSGLGYPQEQLIDAPIPVNPNIYRTYELSEHEKKEYETDICVFSNAGNPRKALDDLLLTFKGNQHYSYIEKALTNVFYEAYQAAYDEKTLFSSEQYRGLIIRHFTEVGLSISEKSLDTLTPQVRNNIGYRIFRSVPIEWLNERGYKMKLWGQEWLEHPKLSKYAQGIAPNGEVLSKIINASKIVIGTSPIVSSHPRNFETILSNCFYLGINIPEQYDWANIRRFMNEDKEIVLFYGKEDLYSKVDYYLEHEDKRKEIIENGKKKILAELTYEKLMKRVINEIAEKLEKQIEKEK